jgi:hypothetical protein
MPRTVCDQCDELSARLQRGIRAQLIDNIANRRHDIQILQLAVIANVITFSSATPINDCSDAFAENFKGSYLARKKPFKGIAFACSYTDFAIG